MVILCEQCSSSGLPILPVRYTVVPTQITPSLPGWAGGNQVTSVPLAGDYHYALRTLRSGYVYLFYAKNARGSNQWECFSVGEDGCLTKQPSLAMARPQPTPEFQCSRLGHTHTNVHYLVVDKPEQCGPTWIAFSEHKWSNETINEYTTNGQLRDARMQTLHPAQMIEGAKHSHGSPVDAASLQGVIEYAPSFTPKNLPYEGVPHALSDESGSYTATFLTLQSTRYPWYQRHTNTDATVKSMQQRALKKDGTPGTPHVLALWDAVGIAHELNGYRNEAAGRVEQYGKERELQISAVSAIDGLQQVITDHNTEALKEWKHDNRYMPDTEISGVRKRAVSRYAKGNPTALGAPLYELDQQLKLGQLDEATYKAKRSDVIAKNSSNPQAMEAEYDKIDTLRDQQAQRQVQAMNDTVATQWSKYEAKLNFKAKDNFKQQWQLFLNKADSIIDQRTQALVHWLEAPLFIHTLEDYHPANINDGLRFEDVVGTAIFGIGSSQSGAKKIDEWVKEAKATIKTNLVWRVIAMNQQEYLADVDQALQLVYGKQVNLTSQTWANAAEQVKWNKIADLGKKSLGLFNTQTKAVNDPSSGIKAVENTRGLEKLLTTVGGHWLKPFTWTVDTVNEAMLRALLLVRGGANLVAAKELGAWDAIHAATDRDMLVRRLLNQKYYLDAAATAEYETQAQKWKALKSVADIPDAQKGTFNAVRDARLSLVVAVFEAFNLYKANANAAKEPKSEKVQAQLTAAQFATAAAAIDVLSNMVKGLASDKVASYQALKFGGGALSVVASGYGAALDFGDARQRLAVDDYRLGTLYATRWWFQLVSATLTGLTALSYCSPLIETFGKKFGERMVGRFLIARAKQLLLARAALMFASLEVSMFLLAVTAIIWGFEDDELQKWCDRSAFGVDRKKLSDAYTTADEQMQKYAEALKEVM